MTRTAVTRMELAELEREIATYLRVVDDFRADGIAPEYLNEDLERSLLAAAGVV